MKEKLNTDFLFSFFIFYILIYLIMKAFIFPVILILSPFQIYALILCFDEDINEMQNNCNNIIIEKINHK